MTVFLLCISQVIQRDRVEVEEYPRTTGELTFISTVRTNLGEADSTNNGALVKLNVTKEPLPQPSKGGGGGSNVWLLWLISGYFFLRKYHFYRERYPIS